VRPLGGYTTPTMEQTLIHGRYLLGDLLGSGGMARVFLAHDEVLDRDVALKVLRDQYAESEEFVERFRREAQSAAALNHPNIVLVYDWGRSEDGTYYMAMEYVPGGTLKDLIATDGPLDPDTIAELGCQVAEALEFAHERGVIHRDVKPQNILLTASGDVKVADFGIARAVGAMASTAISQTGLVLGTVSYISPEQAMSEPVGPASDLYSLGVVLYEMLTGELPFEAEALMAVCMKHLNEPPRPPKELNPEVSEGMNALVSKLLAKRAGDRYRSAAELSEDLRRLRAGLLPRGVGAAVVDPGATWIATQTTAPLAATARNRAARRGKKRAKAPWILVATFALFALLGGSGWNLLHGSWGRDPIPGPEDSQVQGSAPGSEDEITNVSEETEQGNGAEVASAKGQTQTEAPSNTVPNGAAITQDPPVETVATPSALPSTPVNDTSRSKPQPDPARQAQAQVGSGQGAQVRVVSSKLSSGEGANGQKTGGNQGAGSIKQVSVNPKHSHK
jgi:tRNA A-37 threonylcarbamoyl transferase component Bud32